jgi:hypothetical protein
MNEYKEEVRIIAKKTINDKNTRARVRERIINVPKQNGIIRHINFQNNPLSTFLVLLKITEIQSYFLIVFHILCEKFVVYFVCCIILNLINLWNRV